MPELTPVCTLNDVELYLHADVPANLTGYVGRKIGASGNVLRRLMRNEGKDLDALINPTSPDYDQLTYEQARDAVAVNVALDVKRVIDNQSSEQDLSSFSTFTQTAGGYSFSGTWAGNSEDVFFTSTQLANLGIGRATISQVSL